MAHRLLILEWLYKADQDFGLALLTLQDTNRSFYDQICTSFHQAVEKYLKAYIVAHELSFRKLHDLEKLLRTCITHDATISSLEEACRFLNPFYVELRYADTPFFDRNETSSGGSTSFCFPRATRNSEKAQYRSRDHSGRNTS